MQQFPRVGVGVIVVKDGKVLLGKRNNSQCPNNWGFPGGHLEFGEGLEACATREVMEETGLEIKNIRRAGLTNDLYPDEGKHYVNIVFMADWAGGEPRLMEPEKCEGWD